MKLLIYGAGVLGSLYAARLHEAGNEVSLLARGERLTELREKGIVLEHALSGRRSVTHVRLVEELSSADAYDWIIVLVRKNQVHSVLPSLQGNHGTPNVLMMVNNALGYNEWAEVVGAHRLIAGFAGAGGTREGRTVRFIVASRWLQPTTFGEIDGRRTTRLKEITSCFQVAGFPTSISRNMDAWQKCHLAWISPVAHAIYSADGDNYRLSNMQDKVRLTVRAIHEGFDVLQKLGYPIMPAKLHILRWTPETVLATILRRWFGTRHCEVIAAHHANAAVDEMRLLAQEFRELADSSGVPTPARDALEQFIPVA